MSQINNKNREFHAFPSKGGICSLFSLVIVSLIFILILIFNHKKLGNIGLGVFIGITVMMVTLFGLLSWAFYSMKYQFGNSNLIIKYCWVRKEINYDNIENLGVIEYHHYSSLKLGGAALPGLYLGRFSINIYNEELDEKIKKKIRRANFYSTKMDMLLLLTNINGNKTFGISPDGMDEFILELQKRNPHITKIKFY